MIVAVVILALALAGAVAAIVWLAKRGFSYADQLIARAQTEANEKVQAERSSFEADASKASLEDEKTTNANLEEALQTHVDENPSAALAPDDIAGRLLRAQHAAGDAGDAGDSLPAVAGAPVLAAGSKAGAVAAAVPKPR